MEGEEKQDKSSQENSPGLKEARTRRWIMNMSSKRPTAEGLDVDISGVLI